LRLFETLTGYWGQTVPLAGDGPGSHSSFAAQLDAAGPWVEDEGSRWVAELGVAGYLGNLARQVGALVLVVVSAWALVRGRIDLACLASLGTVVALFGGMTAQPSLQGLTAILFALVLTPLSASSAARRHDDDRADRGPSAEGGWVGSAGPRHPGSYRAPDTE
jgi:hypothetical protein